MSIESLLSIWAIRRNLDAGGGLLPLFEKPGWMPQRQFVVHSPHYLILAGRLDFMIKGYWLRKQRHWTASEGHRYPRRGQCPSSPGRDRHG